MATHFSQVVENDDKKAGKLDKVKCCVIANNKHAFLNVMCHHFTNKSLIKLSVERE